MLIDSLLMSITVKFAILASGSKDLLLSLFSVFPTFKFFLLLLFQTTSNERAVAFWLWIDGILDLIKRCLLNIWNDG